MSGDLEATADTFIDTGRRSFLKAPLVVGAAGALLYAGYSGDADTNEEPSTKPVNQSPYGQKTQEGKGDC